MIELDRHIEILLLSNDCVMVPGLGGFVTHHVDACYNDEEKTFFPPLRTIGFNPKLNINDSLLTHSYTEAYDLSYPEAEKRIEQEVDELKKELQASGSYTLNDIGVLAINSEGAYEFTPCEAGILTPELYGLCSFEMPMLNNVDAPAVINVETKPVKDAATVDAVSEAFAKEAADGNDNTIRINISAIRNVVAFAIATIAFFFISTPLGYDNQKDIKMGAIENGVIYRLMPKDVTLGDVNLKINNGKDGAKVSAEKKKAEATSAVAVEKHEKTPERYFCIVMASHITKKNAEAFAEQLHKEGFDSAQVLHGKGYTKVVYGRYSTETEAQARLRSLRGDSKFHDSWIYQVKN